MNCRTEKRPLRLSELVKELPEVAWVEYVYGDKPEPKIPTRIKKNGYFGDALDFTDGSDIALITYGTTWRVWPEIKPTEAEMEDAAWIREAYAEEFKPKRVI